MENIIVFIVIVVSLVIGMVLGVRLRAKWKKPSQTNPDS